MKQPSYPFPVSLTQRISERSLLAAALVSSLGGFAQAQPYSNTSRDVLAADTGTWSSGGVTLNGTQFVNLGLQGVGRVAANSTQTIGGVTETLGSISDMQITNWVKNGNGTFSGTFHFLPDRGYNAGAIFSNYAARINTFDFTFTPYTSSATTPLQDQIAMTYTGASRFTYDHDANSGTAPVLTTGLVANSAATNFLGQPVPTVTTNTTIGTDGPIASRLTLDSEGLILDHRPGKNGEGWIGDEYGAFIYHFNASKEIDGVVTIPAALVPHSPAGGPTYFTDSPANADGRRINQGMEGIAISPDGTRLIAMLQSATLQDSGSGNQGRTNTRILVYDISGGAEVPTDPIAQYVLQLPRINADLTGGVDRAGAQSGIVALDNSKILILSRDGNGRGPAVATGPVFKSILLADLSTGTNIDGTYDAAGADLTPSGDTLLATVTPVAWTQALNMLGKLDLGVTELEQFGLNLLGNDGDANTISEKWEALSLVSAKDPANPNDYFLFVGNDNDFQTRTGTLIQADGTPLAYDAGLENDTMVLAYRVRMVSNALAPTFNVAATAGLSTNANNLALINLSTAAAPSPAGGTFSGPGVSGNFFDPGLVAVGVHVITYSYIDSFGATQSATFNITVSAAQVPSYPPTGALTSTLKGSINLTGSEIPAFDPGSKRAFASSGVGIQVIDLANPAAPAQLATIVPSALGVAGLTSDDVSSIAVRKGTGGNPSVLAAAIINSPKTNNGHVVFLNAATGALLGSATVGAVPDHIAFTPDGTKLLVCNEGELPLGAAVIASETVPGSVSVVDLTNLATPAVATAGFASFNASAAALKTAGVRIFNGGIPEFDFEPEYLAISPDGAKAIVTLQEANAVAILDIASATFTSVVPLGEKDFSTIYADFSDRDVDGTSGGGGKINLTTGNPVFGLYMPDAIASYQVGGQTYYVTSNEGDDRDDFLNPDETIRVSSGSYDLDNTKFPNETTLKNSARLGRLTVFNTPGLRGDTDGDGLIDKILMLGGRSFSILDSNGARVFDSGDMIESIASTLLTTVDFDDRSDNKGPEPEGVTIAKIGARTFAFIGLERANMTLAFDVTNPIAPTYAAAFQRSGDFRPEGLVVIEAADSPSGKPLLMVANEGSPANPFLQPTLTIFEIGQPTDFKLQLLHLADAEAGLLASSTAPNLAALVDGFDNTYPNTLILAGGDNFIPGPFIAGGTDLSVRDELNTVSGSTMSLTSPTFNHPTAAVDIAIHNIIGVEASTIGNHEFDLGTRVFSDAIRPGSAGGAAGWAGANFPYLSANLDFSLDSDISGRFTNTLSGNNTALIAEASTLKGRIAPSAIITKGGQKIGLVAATTQILESISSTGGVEVRGFSVDGTETNNMQLLADQLQPAIDELRSEGVNKIILMAHLQQITFEQQLAPLLNGVDIVLAAGSNTRLGDSNDVAAPFNGHGANFAGNYPIYTAGSDGLPTVIVNTDNEFTYLGRLVADFDSDGVLIVPNLTANIVENGAYAATDANVAAAWNTTVGNLASTAFVAGSKGAQVKLLTDAVQAVINAKDGDVRGYTNVYLEGERNIIRNQETNLGNITADSMVAVTKAALPTAAHIVGFKNGGGIRSSIGAVEVGSGLKTPPIANPSASKPAGAVSLLDIENSLRFNNSLMVCDTTPAGLKAILEHGVALLVNQGRFPQVGGIRFSYNPGASAGSRVQSIVLVDENDIITGRVVSGGAVRSDAPALITVVTLNFLAGNTTSPNGANAAGGDGYPFRANADNFRYLLNNGSLSPPVNEDLDFSSAANVPVNILGEQRALSNYLQSRYATPAAAYDIAETAPSLDTRIQNRGVRTDTVPNGLATFNVWLADNGLMNGNSNGDGDSLTDLEEFAYGLNRNSFDSAILNANIPTGTLTARGTPTIYSAPTPVGQDFRYVFIRVKNAASVGITYTPQFSDVNLGSWESRGDLEVTVIASDGDYELVSVKYPFFTQGKKAQFARMAISQN